MSSLAQITTHVADAQARVLQQQQHAPRFNALLTAFVGEIQNIENALYAVLGARTLAGSTGGTLDALGALVGAVGRNGLTDAQYRPLVYGQIGVNNADGTTASLIGIAQGIFGATSVFIRQPDTIGETLAPATVTIGIGSPTMPATENATAVRLLNGALSAGVSLSDVYSFSASGAFSMAGPQSWVKGFADNNGNGGGAFAQCIYSAQSL